MTTKEVSRLTLSLKTLQKNLEEQVGHQGLFKVSLVESVTEIWIYNFSQEVQRMRLTEETSKFYCHTTQYYQDQDRSKCKVGCLLAASNNQMNGKPGESVVIYRVWFSDLHHSDNSFFYSPSLSIMHDGNNRSHWVIYLKKLATVFPEVPGGLGWPKFL